MFIRHKEGTTELVYEVKVNIPPVGIVYDYIQKEWVKVMKLLKKDKVLKSYLMNKF